MLSRCTNKNATAYERYGGRGIKVCDRWLGPNGYANFLADMGDRPEYKTLDRFPNRDGDYEPTNCRWATAAEQAQHRRSTKLESHEPEQIRWLVGLGYSQRLVGRFFGVTQSNIHYIVHGDSRKLGERRRSLPLPEVA